MSGRPVDQLVPLAPTLGRLVPVLALARAEVLRIRLLRRLHCSLLRSMPWRRANCASPDRSTVASRAAKAYPGPSRAAGLERTRRRSKREGRARVRTPSSVLLYFV